MEIDASARVHSGPSMLRGSVLSHPVPMQSHHAPVLSQPTMMSRHAPAQSQRGPSMLQGSVPSHHASLLSPSFSAVPSCPAAVPSCSILAVPAKTLRFTLWTMDLGPSMLRASVPSHHASVLSQQPQRGPVLSHHDPVPSRQALEPSHRAHRGAVPACCGASARLCRSTRGTRPAVPVVSTAPPPPPLPRSRRSTATISVLCHRPVSSSSRTRRPLQPTPTVSRQWRN